MAEQDEKKQIWVDLARAAIGSYVEPDDIDDQDELVDDMVNVSTKYADAMLKEFEARFNEGKPRKRRKKTEPDDDDDD